MFRAGEHGHVGTGLGHNDLGGALPDPGDGADQVAERTKRGHRAIDPLVQLVDLTCPLVDGLQMEAGGELQAWPEGRPEKNLDCFPGWTVEKPGVATHTPFQSNQ